MNAVIDTNKGISTEVFKQAVKVEKPEEIKVSEPKVDKAAGADSFIKKEELTEAAKTPEKAVITNKEDKAASQEQVDETWNQVANTIQNETKELSQTDAKVKIVEAEKPATNTETQTENKPEDTKVKIAKEESTLSLGGEEKVAGTDVKVNTVATEEQFKEIQTQIERNQKILEKNNRNIDLSVNDDATKKKNEEVRQAYNNIYQIEEQLKEYESKLTKQTEDQNRIDAINEEEKRALAKAQELRKIISDFNKEANATIRLQNGAFITNNAITMDGKGIEIIAEPGKDGLSDTQVAIKYNYDGKEFERLIDTNDKYTSISQTPEENKANKAAMGSKGLLAAIKNNSKNNPTSLKAVAYNKQDGQAVDMANIKPEDGIPTEITIGLSKSASEIEKGTDKERVSNATLEKLKNDPEYREQIIEVLRKAQEQNVLWKIGRKENVTNAGYWAKQLANDDFDPTQSNEQQSLLATVNRALAVINPETKSLDFNESDWVLDASETRGIGSRNTPETQYKLTLSPEQRASMRTAFAGNNKLFNYIKDNENNNEENGNYEITLNKNQYETVTEALKDIDYAKFNPEAKKIELNSNASEYAGRQQAIKNNEGVVTGIRTTVDTSKLPEEVRMQLANHVAANNDFGTFMFDWNRDKYDALITLKNGGTLDAQVVQGLINSYNANIAS